MAIRPSSFSVGAGPDRETLMSDATSIGRAHEDTDIDIDLLQQRARIRLENMKLLERRIKGDPTLPKPERIRVDDSSSVASSVDGGGHASPDVVEEKVRQRRAYGKPDDDDSVHKTQPYMKSRHFAEMQSIPDSEAGGDLYTAPSLRNQGKRTGETVPTSQDAENDAPGFSWATLGLVVVGGVAIGAGVGLLLGKFLFFSAATATTTTVPVAGATFAGAANAVNASVTASGPAATTAATNAGTAAVAAKSSTIAVQTAMLNSAHTAAVNTSLSTGATAFTEAGVVNTVTTTSSALPWGEAAAFGATCAGVGALTAGAVAMKVSSNQAAAVKQKE